MVNIARIQVINSKRNKSYQAKSQFVNNNTNFQNGVISGKFSKTKQINNSGCDPKQILDIVYFKNYSIEESAILLSISPETIKKKLRLAITELRKRIDS